MSIEYVYADLGVTVTVSGDNGCLIESLSDADEKCLQQWLYLAVTCFVYAKAVYAAERSQENGVEG